MFSCFFCRLWMDGLFVWMKQEREDAPEEVLARARVVVDSAGPGGEVGEVTPEVITSSICCGLFLLFAVNSPLYLKIYIVYIGGGGYNGDRGYERSYGDRNFGGGERNFGGGGYRSGGYSSSGYRENR